MNNKFFSLFVTLISFVLAFIGDVQAQSTIVDQGGLGSCGTGCSWTLYSNGKLEVTGTGENAEIANRGTSYGPKGGETSMPWRQYLADITDIEVQGISTIKANAFRGMQAVERISMDETTKSIGDCALHTYHPYITIIPTSVTTLVNAFNSNSIIYCPKNKKTICIQETYGGNPKGIYEYTQNPDGSYTLLDSDYEIAKYSSFTDFQNGNSFEKYGYDKSGKQYLLSDNGQLFLKQSDGSSYYFNEEGELVSIKGKRIYTVDEATFMTSKGKNKNTFSIRYR